MGGTSTKAGTSAFLARFEKQVDPTGSLLPEERARRATYARKSYMASLALKASQARRRNLTKNEPATVSETSVAGSAEAGHARRTSAE
jgi:hypothetical protein